MSARHARRSIRATLLASGSSSAPPSSRSPSSGSGWGRCRSRRAEALSVTVLDRNDRLLRAYTTPDGRWRLPVEAKDVDPRYLAMLLAFEDKRFRSAPRRRPVCASAAPAGCSSRHAPHRLRRLDADHAGGAPAAGRARALRRRQAAPDRCARCSSSASSPRTPSCGSISASPRSAATSRACARPRSPTSARSRGGCRWRRRRCSWRCRSRPSCAGPTASPRPRGAPATACWPMPPRQGVDPARGGRRAPWPSACRRCAASSPCSPRTSPRPRSSANKTRLVHRLTIDAPRRRASSSSRASTATRSAAGCPPPLIAVDHTTGEVIAHVGSPGYLDEGRFGAVDMTSAVRSPGSTLKPIIYGLAFEAGLAHPETLIEDRPTRFGVYVPKNFDQDWHGTVTIRMALAQSLNIPAVKVLDALGRAEAVRPLAPGRHRAACCPRAPSRRWPSRSAASASSSPTSPRSMPGSPAAASRSPCSTGATRSRAARLPRRRARRLLSPVAAWYVSDILRNAPAPANAKPGQIAYKTGTSYGFRDAWAVGYDGRHTIAVWVGRPDGAATPGLAGRIAAAPLLFDAFARLWRRGARRCRRAPSGALRRRRHRPAAAAQALPRDQGRVDAAGAFLEPPCRSPSRPTAPSSMSRTATAPRVVVKAEGGALPLTWLVDGVPIDSDPVRREAELPAADPRLPQALRHRRQGPRRPRHHPTEVASPRVAPVALPW